MNLSEKICELQEKSGETNYRLAKELRVKQTTIANWKSGKTKPMTVYAEKLAEHFGVSIEEFLTGGENAKGEMDCAEGPPKTAD